MPILASIEHPDTLILLTASLLRLEGFRCITTGRREPLRCSAARNVSHYVGGAQSAVDVAVAMAPRTAPLLHAAVAATARDLDKCAGCAVVMRSLQKVLSLEHLDEDKTDILSGGRLDGNGNRQGKLVKYATSEFRTSHLLDQVCDYADTFIPRYEGGWAPNATKQQRFEDVVRGKAKPFPSSRRRTTRGDASLEICAPTAIPSSRTTRTRWLSLMWPGVSGKRSPICRDADDELRRGGRWRRPPISEAAPPGRRSGGGRKKK